MPERETVERAREDAREGKSPSTQAGEFVRDRKESASQDVAQTLPGNLGRAKARIQTKRKSKSNIAASQEEFGKTRQASSQHSRGEGCSYAKSRVTGNVLNNPQPRGFNPEFYLTLEKKHET